MYVDYVEFPKRKYHPDGSVVTVQDSEEEKALGEEWANSPAEFEAEAKPKPEAEAKPKRQKKDKPEE